MWDDMSNSLIVTKLKPMDGIMEQGKSSNLWPLISIASSSTGHRSSLQIPLFVKLSQG